MKKINVAIAYDFDGTLAPGYMQDHSFFPELSFQKEEIATFWKDVKKIAEENDMDEILAYMFLMLKEANYRGISIRKKEFKRHGEGMKLFSGVEEWFPRMNRYAKTKGINLTHYIISSGLREMISGTSIASEFTSIFASAFMYNKDEIAMWPALAVNYTNKTQYLFRINKGIANSWDNKSLNRYMPEEERPVIMKNMIYLGDGETDVPAMKMIRYGGGKALAVYEEGNEKAESAAKELPQQKRADIALPADYRQGSELDKQVKSILDEISSSR